jgi:hypothetical protein
MMNAALLVIAIQISALIKGTQSVASTKLEAPKPTPSMTRQVAHPICLFAAVNSATCIEYVDTLLLHVCAVGKSYESWRARSWTGAPTE